jgi:phosphoribosylformylglycinamidine cyclo-ligase
MTEQWDYKKAGLDLAQYEQTIAGIQPLLARTHDRRVLPPPFPPRKGGKGVGGFASLFHLNPDGRYRDPVLVTCTDGVGSKLKIATLLRRFDTVGIDLVAMSVNDLICTGGEPLVFLDYLAMPQDNPELSKALLQGISEGCLEAGCSLVGGETAILPDFYQPGDFDLAGFAAGLVERDRIIDGRAIQPGDRLIGVASSGLHSNGYSLVRKIVFDVAGHHVGDYVDELGTTVGTALLKPTRLYARPVRGILNYYTVKNVVHGIAHITGGGLHENLERILPPSVRVLIDRDSWSVPPIFSWLQRLGEVPTDEMERVFNMGIGLVLIVSPFYAESIRKQLADYGLENWLIGRATSGPRGVAWAG